MSKEENYVSNKSKEIAEVFSYYDREHNGTIKREDIGKVMRSCGFAPTNKQIEDLKKRITKEILTKPELESILVAYLQESKELAKSPEQKLLDAFTVLDREKKGYVSSSDLKHVLTSIGETLTPQEVDEMYTRAGVDVHKDIHLNFGQFKSLFLFAKKD